MRFCGHVVAFWVRDPSQGPDGQMVGEIPWNANGLGGFEHEPGKENEEAGEHISNRQTRQIEPQSGSRSREGIGSRGAVVFGAV